MSFVERVECGLTTAGDADVARSLVMMIERLVDVMERSDKECFFDDEPVSGDEWFGVIDNARRLINAIS